MNNMLHESVASASGESVSSGGSQGSQFMFPGSSFPGMLYKHRVKSFVDNNWPWINPTFRCNPDKLAMAGLMFFGGKPSAKCFVCYICLDDLQENSDPWKVHAEQNKNCPFIKLGQRKLPSDYTIEELFELFKGKNVHTFANGYKSMQLELYNTVLKLAGDEAEIPEK